MQIVLQILRFAHILAVVFMAWPLYALIAVNERGRLGSPLGGWADRYMENQVAQGLGAVPAVGDLPADEEEDEDGVEGFPAASGGPAQQLG